MEEIRGVLTGPPTCVVWFGFLGIIAGEHRWFLGNSAGAGGRLRAGERGCRRGYVEKIYVDCGLGHLGLFFGGLVSELESFIR